MRRRSGTRNSPLLFLSGSELDRVVGNDGAYELLAVGPEASPEEVKRSYRAKAKEFHPDLHPHRAEDMVRLNEARELLCSRKLRRAYDWLRR